MEQILFSISTPSLEHKYYRKIFRDFAKYKEFTNLTAVRNSKGLHSAKDLWARVICVAITNSWETKNL